MGLVVPFASKFKKQLILAVAALSLVLFSSLSFMASAASNGKGFDVYGYNNNARIFVGNCVDWFEGKYGPGGGEAYCGSYSNDQIVMKWNKAWDDCNDAGNDDAVACSGAWVNNEWNGANGGSGEVWHYKIVWNSETNCGADGTPLDNGGYCIWGHYAMLMDQGTAGGEHFMSRLANPAGYGAYKVN